MESEAKLQSENKNLQGSLNEAKGQLQSQAEQLKQIPGFTCKYFFNWDLELQGEVQSKAELISKLETKLESTNKSLENSNVEVSKLSVVAQTKSEEAESLK